MPSSVGDGSTEGIGPAPVSGSCRRGYCRAREQPSSLSAILKEPRGRSDVQVLGTTWGDPRSPSTYSGVPVSPLRGARIGADELAGGIDLRMIATVATSLGVRSTCGAPSWPAARRQERDLAATCPETLDHLSGRLIEAQRRAAVARCDGAVRRGRDP